ncbi:MAG: PAS domain S-box protein, partial [Planctomycetota bacterium]
VNMSNACETHHPARGFRSRMRAGVDWFIPAHVRGGDLDVLRRARLVVAFTWTLIAAALFYAPIFFLMNSPMNAAALIIAAGVGLATLYVMRRTGSSFTAGNLLTAAFFGTLTALACRLGGQGSIALPWYAGVPVVALSTAGRRSAFFWLAVTASSLAAFYALGYTGYSFPNDLTPHHYDLLCLLVWIGLVVLMLALAFLYEAAKNQTLAELKNAEETLRRERDFAEGLVETAQVIVLVLDTEGRIVRFNQHMEDISGYRLEEVQGRDWFTTLLPERDHKRIRAVFSEARNDIQTRGNVNPIVTKRGHECEIEWYSKTLKDSSGHIVGLLVVGQDVTERKQHEEVLEQAKQTAEGHARRATEALADMEQMNAVMMGRELRVLEVKQEVNDLLAELGQARKYEHV